jgi:hypothetical protein
MRKMRVIATSIAKHAAVLLLAILAAVFAVVEANKFFAIMCMFSDEVEAETMCTDANSLAVAAVTFLAVSTFIYGLWGLARLCALTKAC